MIKIANRLSIITLVGAIISLTACKDDELSSSEQLAVDIKKIEAHIADNNIQGVKKTESGLHYVITEFGAGGNAQAGQRVVTRYHGTLLDGTVFDSSIDRGETFDFVLGQGRVIKGWDEGFALLNKGAKASLYIPSGLAYGSQARSAVIKATSVLVFDVELVDIK